MRFRLGTTGAEQQQPYDGIGNGMRNLFALPALRAQAEGEAQLDGMKRNLLAAQTDEHAAKAEAERTQLQRGGIGELLKSAALQRGVPLHQLDEASSFFQSGQLPQKYEMEPTLPGPTMPKPQYADPAVGAKIMETLGLTRQALTVGDKNVENIARAAGAYQDQGITQQAVDAAGRGDDMAMSRLNAVRGKKEFTPFAAVGNTGVALNQVTGQGTTADPGLRAIFGDVQGANILRDKAAASSSYASAGQHRAQTDKIRQELDQGARTGDLQVVTGTDGAITIVNKRDRTAQPVLGADGKPVMKGAAGGGGKPMTEGQSKANLFGGRMMESGKILDDLEQDGVHFPGQVKGAVEGVAGAIPLIGDSLREGAGSIMNRAPTYLGGPSDRQQQVDQAQRDFINAVLRRESGAAISASEFENARKQYFLQPGEEKNKKLVDQKRRARQIATTLMLQEVPEPQRYRLGMVPAAGAPVAAPAGPGGATGSWDSQPGARTVKVDY